MHEERQAHAEWSSCLTPNILLAIRGKKLLSVADMDQVSIFPKYASQVIVLYFQAGSIRDYIQQRWGEDKLLETIHLFAALKTTPAVIEEDLQMLPAEFNMAYMAWLDKQVGARGEVR